MDKPNNWHTPNFIQNFDEWMYGLNPEPADPIDVDKAEENIMAKADLD